VQEKPDLKEDNLLPLTADNLSKLEKNPYKPDQVEPV